MVYVVAGLVVLVVFLIAWVMFLHHEMTKRVDEWCKHENELRFIFRAMHAKGIVETWDKSNVSKGEGSTR